MKILEGSILNQPFWIVALSIGILVLLGFIIYVIDKSRQKRKEEVRANNVQSNFINYDGENVIKRADNYRRLNPNYNNVDLSKLITVYYIGRVHCKGNDRLQMMFVRFTSLSVRGSTLIATYHEEIPSGVVHGFKKVMHTCEMNIDDFNKTFFESKELAQERLLEIIKNAKPNEYPCLYPEPDVF